MALRGIIPIMALTLLSTLATGCGLERSDDGVAGDTTGASVWPDAFEADRARYSIQHQNEVMRILSATFGPGESSVMHTHPLHCSFFLDDGSWVVGFPEAPPYSIQVEAGELWCDGAGPHQPTNATQRRARVVVLELDDDAPRGTSSIDGPDPIVVDPAHHQVLRETYSVRVSRVTYDAGEVGVEHGHPAYCVVWLTVEATPNGPRVGDVDCSFSEVHTPGPFASPIELLLVEFTGRAVA